MLLSSIALFLAVILFFVGILPSLAMAQQQQQTTTTTTSPPPSLSITTIPPLTPEEQEQQNRLQNVIAATNLNLDEAEKEVNGIVYTPRWSEPVWVEPDSLAVLIAYCLPGEFADSGQEILGGFELEVLESYEVALPQGFMAWMMVVGNEDRQDRLPAAVGVICASDLNEAETRVLSPQEQQQINNVIQQFTTQVTNIEQVINIINNVTTTTPTQNGTGGGVTEQPLTVEIIISNAVEGPTYTTFLLESKVTGGTEPYTSYSWEGFNRTVTPGVPDNNMMQVTVQPGRTVTVTVAVTDSKNQTASDSIQLTVRERPPPTNDTGGNDTDTGGGGVGTIGPRVPGGGAGVIPENATAEADRTPPKIYKSTSETYGTFDPAGAVVSWRALVQDDVDGTASLYFNAGEDELYQDNIGGDIDISCNPSPSSVFPIGVTTVQCTAIDSSGNAAQASFTITVELLPPPTEEALVGEQTPPPVADEEEAPVEEEEQPSPTDEGAAPRVEEEEPVTEEEEAATTPPPANEGGGGG